MSQICAERTDADITYTHMPQCNTFGDGIPRALILSGATRLKTSKPCETNKSGCSNAVILELSVRCLSFGELEGHLQNTRHAIAPSASELSTGWLIQSRAQSKWKPTQISNPKFQKSQSNISRAVASRRDTAQLSDSNFQLHCRKTKNIQSAWVSDPNSSPKHCFALESGDISSLSLSVMLIMYQILDNAESCLLCREIWHSKGKFWTIG